MGVSCSGDLAWVETVGSRDARAGEVELSLRVCLARGSRCSPLPSEMGTLFLRTATRESLMCSVRGPLLRAFLRRTDLGFSTSY